ncbi:MAG: hypothetical protein LBT79_03070 [Elusimicrobiota bacterium]|jgi:hypothetical protein|nr:hypothetical protein [Elusimicrobiota bacterium]
MSTSSIGRSVIINDERTVRKLVRMIEEADKNSVYIKPYPISKLQKDAEEISKCISRQLKK